MYSGCCIVVHTGRFSDIILHSCLSPNSISSFFFPFYFFFSLYSTRKNASTSTWLFPSQQTFFISLQHDWKGEWEGERARMKSTRTQKKIPFMSYLMDKKNEKLSVASNQWKQLSLLSYFSFLQFFFSLSLFLLLLFALVRSERVIESMRNGSGEKKRQSYCYRVYFD